MNSQALYREADRLLLKADSLENATVRFGTLSTPASKKAVAALRLQAKRLLDEAFVVSLGAGRQLSTYRITAR